MKMYTIQVLDNNTINKYIFRRYERKNEICTKDRNDKCLFHTDEEIDVYLFFCQKKKSNKAPYFYQFVIIFYSSTKFTSTVFAAIGKRK